MTRKNIVQRDKRLCSSETGSLCATRAALASGICALLLCFCGLVWCGVVFGLPSLYGVACVPLSAAALLLLFYLWLGRRFPFYGSDGRCYQTQQQVWSVGNYYNQAPPGLHTDFPMGPYLVLSLPERHKRATPATSASSTPRYHKTGCGGLGGRARNLPPLASEETISPSLLSSRYGSVDSVV